MEKTMKFSGKLKVVVKQTSQGVLGIVDDYPIVVESQNNETLSIDIMKAMSAYAINYPKEFLSIMKLSKIPA